MIKIGITGHMDLGNEQQSIRERIDFELKKIKEKHNGKELVAYSALAVGSDTVFAETALENNFKLRVIIPFLKEEYEKDWNGDNGKLKTFRALMGKAQSVRVINDVSKAYTDAQKNQGYYDCGAAICNEVDEMICVWNGIDSKKRGGTSDMVKYVRDNKISHQIIYTPFNWFWKAFTRIDSDAMAAKAAYQKYWKYCWGLSLVASFIFAVSLSFVTDYHIKTVLSIIEVLLVMSIFFIWRFILLKSKSSKGKDEDSLKQKAIQLRRDAERMRLIHSLVNSVIEPSFLPNRNHIKISDAVNKNTQKIIENLKDSNIGFDLEEARNTMLDLVNNQKVYHTNLRPPKIAAQLHANERKLNWLIAFFIMGLLLHCIELLVHCELVPDMFLIPHSPVTFSEYVIYYSNKAPLFLCLICPPMYAALEVLAVFNNWKKNMEDSDIMKEFFTEMAQKLENKNLNQVEINTIGSDIFWEMEAENKGWYNLIKNIATTPPM